MNTLYIVINVYFCISPTRTINKIFNFLDLCIIFQFTCNDSDLTVIYQLF